MIFMDKKAIIRKYGAIISKLYRILHHNKYKIGKGNIVHYEGAFLSRTSITVNGTNNSVYIEPGLTRLYNSSMTINGSNCTIRIKSDCNLHSAFLNIEDDGGQINIGKHVTICGKTNIDVIEGKSVTVGDDCLFSANIQIRVGDSHSVLDDNTGKRINPSKDVVIGNHVWIGNSVDILKGSVIGDNSIVGTRAVVAGKTFHSNLIIGGMPARVLREGVNWCPQRIPVE